MSSNNFPISDLMLEVLTSTARTKINREDFIFSAPQKAGDKGEASIMITPLQHTDHYGVVTINYFRFNLSDHAVISINYQGEKTLHDVLERLKSIRVYKYFVWDKDHKGVESRFLRLRLQDFENKELGPIDKTVLITVPCKLDSEIFHGSINIRLLV